MSVAPKTAAIELRLRELAQLFNSLDPSPFIDRDLDPDAEEFILSWAREHAKDQELELTLHLATAPPPDRASGTEAAVRHYFETRAEMKRREFRQLMKRGRVSLLIGIVFLAACLFASELIGKLGHTTSAGLIRESLTIGGWVAMWRPLEIYLYDWWPVRRRGRHFQRLATMPVEVVRATPSAHVPDRHATVVERLLDSGASILGSTRLTDFENDGAGITGSVREATTVLGPARLAKISGLPVVPTRNPELLNASMLIGTVDFAVN